MLGELRNIRTQMLFAMALAILDVGRPLSTQEIAELEQIQRELQRRRQVSQRLVTPLPEEGQAEEEEEQELAGVYERR